MTVYLHTNSGIIILSFNAQNSYGKIYVAVLFPRGSDSKSKCTSICSDFTESRYRLPSIWQPNQVLRVHQKGGWWGQVCRCGSAGVTMTTDGGTIQERKREREWGDYVGEATELYNNCLCSGGGCYTDTQIDAALRGIRGSGLYLCMCLQ